MTQEGIWLGEQLRPGRSGYHDIAAVHIRGELDVHAFTESLRDLMMHHQALRCRVHDEVDGVPSQSFDGDRIDFAYRQVSEDEPVDRSVGLDGTDPFDLAAGPLWRVRLIRFGPAEFRLVVVSHHLITDGWSHGVFMEGLLRCYLLRANGSQLSPAPQDYLYTDWIREKIAREVMPPGRVRAAFDRLAGAPRQVVIPGTLDGPGKAGIYTVPVPLSPAALTGFAATCKYLGITGYAGFAGIFAYLLAKMTGLDRVVLAAPVAHREDPRVASMIGCLVDNIAIEVRVDPAAGLATALSAGHTGVARALAYADVPYGALVRAATVADPATDPLTNVSIKQFNVPIKPRSFAGLSVQPLPRTGLRARHDLALSVPSGLGEAPELLARVDRYRPGVVEAIAEELVRLVAEVARVTGA